jgi:hypothetical protein
LHSKSDANFYFRVSLQSIKPVVNQLPTPFPLEIIFSRADSALMPAQDSQLVRMVSLEERSFGLRGAMNTGVIPSGRYEFTLAAYCDGGPTVTHTYVVEEVENKLRCWSIERKPIGIN